MFFVAVLGTGTIRASGTASKKYYVGSFDTTSCILAQVSPRLLRVGVDAFLDGVVEDAKHVSAQACV